VGGCRHRSDKSSDKSYVPLFRDFASTPVVTARAYLLIVCISFFGLVGLRELYTRAAELTCWYGGYQQNAWLAYCNSKRYGVYDIEAIWHRVEPDVARNIAAAQVLTFSDSHMQNALSLGGASEWFAAHHYSLYMLGLPTEESGFAERLIDNFQPHPAVVIFDASPYFTGDVGPSEVNIFKDPETSRAQVMQLKTFQETHQSVCSRAPSLCGHNFAYFRSRLDGHWIFPTDTRDIWIGRRSVPNDKERYPTTWLVNDRQPLYHNYLQAARQVVNKLGLPGRCIVITNVPAYSDMHDLARYLATSLGVTVINPDVPDLATFDRSHLTPESSRRWTQAFLQQLEPLLHSCIPQQQTVAAVNLQE
jgi:hypothetical protein